jgi:hypothetical protein
MKVFRTLVIGRKIALLTMVITLLAETALAQDDSAGLTTQLANPIANLRTLPIQLNFDERIGSDDAGSQWLLNVQPVIPFTLNDDWILISRTIMPIVHQRDLSPTGNESGIGDILQSLFFSPVEPTTGGWIWGAGPVTLFPSATDDSLGSEKLAFGPTAIVLKQGGPWTVGLLGNHLWSVAGPNSRDDINLTYIEPYVTYTTKTDTSLSLNAETIFDWRTDEWSFPPQFTAEQLIQAF